LELFFALPAGFQALEKEKILRRTGDEKENER
jgi:hypothetical protein